MSLTVENLRCEYMQNPIGLDQFHPRLSWQLNKPARNVMQAGYQIQVSGSADFEDVVWDTEFVESQVSIHIAYQGPQLQPRTCYYYRVRVWSEDGESSPWSLPGYWETGMLRATEWQADWITADENLNTSNSQPSPLLQKKFIMQRIPVRARVYVTSLGLYELFMNGKRISDWLFTPGWTSYHKRLQYQTYDVTALVVGGANVIGAVLGNGWYMGELGWKKERNLYGNQRCLLLELYLDYEDGSQEVIRSDASWFWTTGPIRSSEIYHGERYDATQVRADWQTPDFNQDDWQRVCVVSHTKNILVSQENLPTRATEELEPIQVIHTPTGETVLDMGQNLVGWVRFEVEAERGTEITLTHAEVLDQNGNVYTGNLRTAEQRDSYICRGEGIERFEPHFTFHGFRYVKVEGYPGVIAPSRFRAIVIHTDMEQTGHFECSNEMVNQLVENIKWGQRGNFLDVPTDCPQRNERLGWTGDAQVFIRTAAYNMNVLPFFSKWMNDLAADQLENGSVPHVIPNVLSSSDHGSSAWADAAVICPWTMYVHYGDKRILETQYDSMKAWVEFMRLHGECETRFVGDFQYGDWLALDAKEDSYVGATDVSFISNAFYAYSTELLVKTALTLGRTADADFYTDLHHRIVNEFRREFVTPNGRLAVPTQTSHALALWFHLVKDEHRQRIAASLDQLIADSGTHLSTGFVGTPYLCHVLSENGYADTSYQLLFQTDYPSWLYPITRGATTIWEHWDGIKPNGSFWSDDMNSFNHYAYGSIGEWLYRVVAGVDIDENQPGFKHTVIKPCLSNQLSWVKASVDTMYGQIQVEWNWSNETSQFELFVNIPSNTTATVVFPHEHIGTFQSDGPGKDQFVYQPASEGLKKLHPSIVLGSGNYRFSYTVPSQKTF